MIILEKTFFESKSASRPSCKEASC